MNTKRERDASIEPLLRRALGSNSDTSLTGECLDAETLAAWTEGGLGGPDRALAEAHASKCPRCQAVLAAMARMPPPDVEDRSWLRRWYGGWLVPLTAGAIAVAFWFALPKQQEQALSDFRAPQGRLEEPKTPQTPGARADEPQPKGAAEPSPSQQARAAQTPLQQETPAQREAPAPAGSATAAIGRNEGKEEREQSRLSRQDKSDEAQAAASGQKQAADSLAKAAPAPATVPTVAEKAAEPLSGLRDRAAALALPTTASRDIQSPDPSIRWRIGARGSVQYSRDQGTTWEPLPPPVAVDLVAGSAPSPSICWVVGRAGTVLLTTDGRRFERLPFPETTDLTAVRALDARAATVTTADGRSLTTADGGSTWTAVPR